MEKLKQLISGPTYDFLRVNPDLQARYIRRLICYGTNIDGSGVDLRGVAVEQPQYIYGINTFEQFE